MDIYFPNFHESRGEDGREVEAKRTPQRHFQAETDWRQRWASTRRTNRTPDCS